jgi:hypothetical protein
MIADAKELAELVKLIQNDEGLRLLIEAIAERKAQEAVDRHIEEFEHKEKPVTVEEIEKE